MTATADDLGLFGDLIQDGLIGLRGRDTTTSAEAPTYATPGALAAAIDPGTRQTPALDLIDQALVDVDAGRCDRLIISMPPQEGKSTRVTKTGPLWLLLRNKQRRIVIVSYGQELASEFGRDIRSMITSNAGLEGTVDLGMRIAKDNGSVSRWRLAGARGGVKSIGVGGGITGRSADVLIIDDPIRNRAEAESEVYRDRAKNFWTSTGSTRLSPGAPVILVLTRWHDDDLAGWLLGRPDAHRWRVINIPAQADHDPSKGETDPLGREPGEFMESARVDEATGQPRSPTEWEQIRVQAGSRDWEALYQGHPSPPGGTIFDRGDWQTYDRPLWLDQPNGSRVAYGFDELIASWDLTFKGAPAGQRKVSTFVDFVVGQVWGRRGADVYLLDQVRDRMDFPATVAAVQQLAARWPQATLKLVEDKANGPAVIASLQHRVAGIVPEIPQGSKVARASAVSPLVEAHNVYLPAAMGFDGVPLAPWVGDFIEECAGFPNGKHDDQVDAMTQALNRLILQPLMPEQDTRQPEEYDLVDARGYWASPV